MNMVTENITMVMMGLLMLGVMYWYEELKTPKVYTELKRSIMQDGIKHLPIDDSLKTGLLP